MKNFMLAILFTLIVSGCGDGSSENSHETPIAEQSVPNIEQSTNEIQSTSNTKAYRAVSGETEKESIMNHTHTLSWAYYTGDNNRWYISTTLGNSSYSDNIYSLMRIKNGRAGWGTVAENAVVIDAENNELSVDNNLDSNSSNSYYDAGWQEWVEDDLIISDRKGIQGKNVIIKWYFFYVEGTGRWYIINTPEYYDGTSILKFASKDGQYDWQETDTADLKPIFFMESGIPKIKFEADAACQASFSQNDYSHLCWLFDEVKSSVDWHLSGNGVGQGDHLGDDYYADDWNWRSGNQDLGKNLRSGSGGTVIYAGNNGSGYGNQVIVQTAENNNFAIRYTHLNDIYVSVGDPVYVGTLIGTIGISGLPDNQCNAENGYVCAHLHLAVYKNIFDISPRVEPSNQTGLYWLKLGRTPTGALSGGATLFADRFQVDNP